MGKFKKVQSIILALVMLLSLFSGTGLTAWADSTDYEDEGEMGNYTIFTEDSEEGADQEDGVISVKDYTEYTGQTEQGEYNISTAAQLAKLAQVVNVGELYEGSTFKLTADIDLSESDNSSGLTWTGGDEWTPIAKCEFENPGETNEKRIIHDFKGSFDGNGHYIKNIRIDKMSGASDNGYALFGAVDAKGEIKNLGVTGSVASYRCGAGIVAYNYGKVSKCFNEAYVIENSAGGTRGAGGIVSYNKGTVEYCINAGTIYNTNSRAGGVAGYNDSSAKIDHCFNVGTAISPREVNGSLYEGAITATNNGTITNCYYLKGSSELSVGLDNADPKAVVSAFNADGKILGSDGKATNENLIDKLNIAVAGAFIAAAEGKYPVLSWQDGYEWNDDTCTVTIQPASVGTFTTKVGGQPLIGSTHVLPVGTGIKLFASEPVDGYDFNGFTVTVGDKITELGGKTGAATVYIVTSDATLEAKYELTGGAKADVNFCGVGLTLDMLKAHPTTAVFSRAGKDGAATPFTVTGITVADILKNYAPKVKPAALKFTSTPNGDSSNAVYNCGTQGFDWSQVMLIWSQIDSNGVEGITSGEIRSAVNGGGGMTWWKNVDIVAKEVDAALVIRSEEGVFSDRFVSLEQLKAHKTTFEGWKRGNNVYTALDGIKIGDLLSNYVPYGEQAASMAFYDDYPNKLTSKSYDFYKDTYSGSLEGLTGGDFENAMITWSKDAPKGKADETGLCSALNGGAGMHWWGETNMVSVSIKNIVTFSVTPATASIEVKDSASKAVEPAGKAAYILADGEYTYTVKAKDYKDKTGSVTMAGASQVITVTLEKDSGGGPGPGPGGDSKYDVTCSPNTRGSVKASVTSAKAGDTVTLTVEPSEGYTLTKINLSNGTLKEDVTPVPRTTFTFTMPSSNVSVSAVFDKVELTIYTQKGEKGTAETAALFSRPQLESMATKPSKHDFGYIYYGGPSSIEGWLAVVPIEYVTLDDLLTMIGVTFGSGDSIKAAAADNFHDTVSYKNLQSHRYYFDPNGTKKQEVPYVITLQHKSGELTGSTLDKIANSGSPTTNLRSCYGCSEEEYTEKTAMGRRLVSSVASLTIIKSASVNSNTKDGVAPGQPKEETKTIETKPIVSGGKATASLSEKDVKAAVSAAPANTVMEINATSKEEVKTTEVTLAAAAFSALADSNSIKGLKITTNTGSFSLDTATLEGIASGLSGGSVAFSVGLAETSTMTEAQKALVGNHAVYELSVTVGGKKIERFNGTVTVTLPYKLSAGEDPKDVAIYYLGSDGKVEKYRGTYDSATGTVTFKTGHFSAYMPVVEATAAFNDVLLTDWFYNAANHVVGKELMIGTSDTTFGPSTKTTRAMFVTILWRLQGQEKSALSTSPFNDVVDKGAWYYDAVLWAYENDIVKGLSPERFGPSGTLTRQEMVTILHRFAQKFGSKMSATGAINDAQFTDWSGTSSWAKEAMEWAYANKLVSGTSATTLSPGGNATRAQLAEILMRYQ